MARALLPGRRLAAVRADPSGTGGQATARQPAYTLPPQLAAPSGTPSGPPTLPSVSESGAPHRGPGALAKLQHLGGPAASGSGTASSAPTGVLVVAAAILAALLTPRLARSLTRRHRWRAAAGPAQRAEAAWAELLDNLTDHRMGWSASESPRALARRITAEAELAPAAAVALARIASATERARYSTEPASPATLRADTALVRQALAAKSRWTVRWPARLLPPSALAPVRAGAVHMLDVFGWLDVMVHRLAAWLRLSPHRDGRAEA